MHFLRKVKLQSGQKILIYGASGAIGTSAIQIANGIGAKVSAVCSCANSEFVRNLGAKETFDYTKENYIRDLDLYDVVFDAVGRKKSAGFPVRDVLANGGRFISVDDGSPQLKNEDLVYLKELAEAGDLKPVIDRVYPMERIVEAHRYVETGHKKGNVVITLWE